jgi:hypothetical protein
LATAEVAGTEAGGDEAAELAKQLQNPVASLISVPFQANEDFHIGPANGYKFTLNIQPVIPISISKDWNLILRTIVPIISQTDIFGHSGTQSGLGDTTQSFFLSPKAPGWGGLIKLSFFAGTLFATVGGVEAGPVELGGERNHAGSDELTAIRLGPRLRKLKSRPQKRLFRRTTKVL